MKKFLFQNQHIRSVISVFLITIGVVFSVILSLHRQDNRQRASGICYSSGVTKNPDGTYSFAKLTVDSNGDIIDQNNCIVHLLGTNQWWLDSDATAGPTLQNMISQQQVLHTNISRIAVNAYWWKTDVFVPKYNMSFRQLLQQVVLWNKQAGNYVELDIDAEFNEPPCAQNGLSICPHQSQGRIDFTNAQKTNPNCLGQNPDPSLCPQVQELEEYQPTALSALTDLAQIYANDPAVIFDVWNEPGGYIFVIPGTEQNRKQWMDDRINAVRQYDQNAPVIVFTAGLSEDLSHTQPNLVFDFHAYPNFNGVSPITGTSCNTGGTNFSNLQTHLGVLKNAGKGTIIGEWGHCYLNPPSDPTYNQQLLETALKYSSGLTYFSGGELFSKGSLNGNGQLVVQDYQTILANNPSQTITPSTTPASSITPTMTPPTGKDLHIVGSQILDSNNNPVILRGAMIESAFAYTNQFSDNTKDPTTILNPTTFSQMISWGMNAIRINISAWEYSNASFEPRYQNDLTQVINQATSAGLYVILDYHNDVQSGAPTDPDCLGSNGKPNIPLAGAMLQSSDLLWWSAVANQFKSNPNVMYDIINEPKYGNWSYWANGNPNYTYITNPANCASVTGTTKVSIPILGVKDAITAIRATGSKQIIILEPGDAASGSNPQDSGWQCLYGSSCTFTSNPITDSNIIYSKHSYSSVVKPALTSSNPISIWQLDWGPFWNNGPTVPVYYGEWAVLPNPNYLSFCSGNGYMLTNANADLVMNAFLDYMNKYNINWTGWAFTPTHIIQNFTSYKPTSFVANLPSVGAAWNCSDTVAKQNIASLGMGQDIRSYLLAHMSPTPSSSTPTPSQISSGTVTPTPDNGTELSLVIGLHGIGLGGTNGNPQAKGTTAPLNQTRPVTVTLINIQTNKITTTSGQIVFDTNQGLFTGNIAFASLPPGDYFVKVKSDGFLEKQVPHVVHIIAKQTTNIPSVFLTNGDINNDNEMSILDYNILAECYGPKLNTDSCPAQYRPTQGYSGADIDDDNGQVDGPDYNLFLVELSVPEGQ